MGLGQERCNPGRGHGSSVAWVVNDVDIDRNGIIWTALSGSGQLAGFDRRKCKVLNGPTAIGQQCPEGWTLYTAPGPKMKGVTDESSADFEYYNWVDQFNTLGLGENIPIVTGTSSDSLQAFNPATKKWTILRVPYPMGFFSRGWTAGSTTRTPVGRAAESGRPTAVI